MGHEKAMGRMQPRCARPLSLDDLFLRDDKALRLFMCSPRPFNAACSLSGPSAFCFTPSESLRYNGFLADGTGSGV
eukprot:scaffold480_cov257-Pinguiococcus_pyrenoidosus.AAC.24